MEPFFAIVSTVLFQMGMILFCLLKKTAKVRLC
jgi:hypothetical protein